MTPFLKHMSEYDRNYVFLQQYSTAAQKALNSMPCSESS